MPDIQCYPMSILKKKAVLKNNAERNMIKDSKIDIEKRIEHETLPCGETMAGLINRNMKKPPIRHVTVSGAMF